MLPGKFNELPDNFFTFFISLLGFIFRMMHPIAVRIKSSCLTDYVWRTQFICMPDNLLQVSQIGCASFRIGINEICIARYARNWQVITTKSITYLFAFFSIYL